MEGYACAIVVWFLLGAAPILKLPLVEQVALEHRPIPGDEAAPRVLGYLLGGAGVVQDDLGKHIVRPAAWRKFWVFSNPG